MGKAKTFKFRSIDSFSNVFQNPHFTNPVCVDYKGVARKLQGKWNEENFRNSNPVILEFTYGKGRYVMALAISISTKTS